MIYKLYTDEYFKAVQRCTYEVEADTLEQAIEMIKDQEVIPYDYGYIEPVDCGWECDIVIMDTEFNILHDGR
jgi:hypothetical protein